ncbi:MAG: hypothetical protein RLZZ200_2946 [Pseudomonadota bacterium]|jgi:hypothetical protein
MSKKAAGNPRLLFALRALHCSAFLFLSYLLFSRLQVTGFTVGFWVASVALLLIYLLEFRISPASPRSTKPL